MNTIKHTDAQEIGAEWGCLYGCQTGTLIAQWDDKANEELGCDFIPDAWNIDRNRLLCKIEELLSGEWITRVLQCEGVNSK